MSWDRRIPFEQLSRRLIDDFNMSISLWYQAKRKKIASKQVIYIVIALIQLYNGLRAGEAVEAFKEWIRINQEELEIRVEKRKDGATRLAIIPDIVRFNRNIIERCVDIGFGNLEKITKKKYIDWFQKSYNINTHTLRKAWESFMARKLNKDPALISAYQGRKKLESHLQYLRREEAKEEIRKLLRGMFA
ncbi:MAG TPA: hypothetical protein EYH22_03500 [Candidatus Nanopusillus sp.]|nr:hypothetical protein [Candidatus Nanopusillus sp.]